MPDDPTADEEVLIDINDPRVPNSIREHGNLFAKPAHWVIDLGEGEYLLYSEEYELLDAVYNCSPY